MFRSYTSPARSQHQDMFSRRLNNPSVNSEELVFPQDSAQPGGLAPRSCSLLPLVYRHNLTESSQLFGTQDQSQREVPSGSVPPAPSPDLAAATGPLSGTPESTDSTTHPEFNFARSTHQTQPQSPYHFTPHQPFVPHHHFALQYPFMPHHALMPPHAFMPHNQSFSQQTPTNWPHLFPYPPSTIQNPCPQHSTQQPPQQSHLQNLPRFQIPQHHTASSTDSQHSAANSSNDINFDHEYSASGRLETATSASSPQTQAPVTTLTPQRLQSLAPHPRSRSQSSNPADTMPRAPSSSRRQSRPVPHTNRSTAAASKSGLKRSHPSSDAADAREQKRVCKIEDSEGFDPRNQSTRDKKTVVDLVDLNEVPAEIVEEKEREKSLTRIARFQCIICMDDCKNLVVTSCGAAPEHCWLCNLRPSPR